ncbi:MAG: carbonic anhydrase family protein [Rubrivivax sp.]|nr:carbonic anhydrase family protein [Rubrivivax sp.]
MALSGEDAMDKLRQRLSERLAAPGGATAAGTLDLQIGPRMPPPPPHGAQRAQAARAPAPAVEPGAGSKVAGPAVPQPAAMPAGNPTAAARLAVVGHAPPAAAAATHRAAAPAHRAAAVAGAAAPSGAAAQGLRRAGAAHRPGEAAHGAHWGYEGLAGPAAWGAMRPEFSLCGNGQRQSPIDIRGGLPVDLEPVRFDYKPTAFGVIDNGHTVQVNLPPGNAIEVGARRYELVQFHFHRPSEERIDGRQFEMSLHLVHRDAAGKLAVVAVLLGKGPAHPAVQMVWNNLPLEKHEEASTRSTIDPGHLLPADPRYFTYMGSLTTPPCSEGVLWVVMRTPVTLAEEQLELFTRIYPMNARPLQPVAGRRIMQSQ